MEVNKMKNIVVLKNLPSNLIDEAFVIFKPNKKVKMQDYIEQQPQGKEVKTKSNERDYMIKEAEMVISNYLSNIEKSKQMKSLTIKQLEARYKKLKILTYLLGTTIIINLAFIVF